MRYITFPIWIKLLINLVEDDKWVTGSKQDIMASMTFYNIAPELERIGLLRSRQIDGDKRVKEYSLTFDGWAYANLSRRLNNLVMGNA